MRGSGKMHLRRLVGGRERQVSLVGTCTRLAMVAVLLAVAMLSSAGVASADGGKGKGPQPANITWESRVDRGDGSRALNVTWE